MRCNPTLAPDHPSDEDLSLGTPVRRKDGARKFVFSYAPTGIVARGRRRTANGAGRHGVGSFQRIDVIHLGSSGRQG